MRRSSVLGLVAALAALLFVFSPPARAASPATAGPRFGDAAGIHVVAIKRLDPRQYNVSVVSPALGRPVNIRILLPSAYSSEPDKRFPVLYLFHGTSGGASDWVEQGNAEKLTAGLPLIVVMPDAGFDDDGGGWFTNWVDTTTALGPSQWETFHIDQLIPWVDHNLRTVATRNGRAVAGLSQGGFGSTTYAARHPDLFVSAASFSGAPDIDYDPGIAAGATVVIEGTAFGLDRVEPQAMFGSRATDEINWQGHDPTDLITNLIPVSVYLYTATGAPGPYDQPAPNPGAMGIEALTHASTEGFYQRAMQLGIPVHMDDYTYGTHSWPYWSRDLSEYLVPMMRTFANPPAPPARVSYSSVDQKWTQWGWTVSFTRSASQEWSELAGASAAGFALTGTGSAKIMTPGFYRPGGVETVRTVDSKTQAVIVKTIRADGQGRLHLSISLGGTATPAVLGEPGVQPGDGTVAVSIAAA